MALDADSGAGIRRVLRDGSHRTDGRTDSALRAFFRVCLRFRL